MVRFFLFVVVWSLRAALRSRGSVALENLALRQQLASYARAQKHPQLKPEERSFWVALSRLWAGWRSVLVVVKPATAHLVASASLSGLLALAVPQAGSSEDP